MIYFSWGSTLRRWSSSTQQGELHGLPGQNQLGPDVPWPQAPAQPACHDGPQRKGQHSFKVQIWMFLTFNWLSVKNIFFARFEDGFKQMWVANGNSL